MILKQWDQFNRFKQCKTFKIELSKELMSVAQHPPRSRNWCIQEDRKENKSILYSGKVELLVVQFSTDVPDQCKTKKMCYNVVSKKL